METPRLLLRRLTDADADFILELLNTPSWLRFIGDRGVRNPDDARGYIRNGPQHSYEQHGFGLDLVALKESGTPIGLCGLLKRDYLDHPDIGFAFLPDYAGKGYGYEAASAVIAYARTELGLEKIAAITDPDNTGSIRLLEKLGLRFRKRFFLAGTNEDLLLFETD
ncbi:GNAT family N-acetyltransferase [Larkinella soli]|uniref:GNAT family N-acetyltransferase n=1 Tax=Larkinella soli TaxID=1770527 RepID=UPI000FFC1363|nr:GNAT family N-acetyltransferase [Larkinella soli]